MALEIWLTGEFNIETIYTYAKNNAEWFCVTDLEQGRFTFHLQGVEAVTYQAYSHGDVRIVTDDFSDPGELVQIVWDMVENASGKPPMFNLKKIAPLDTTCYRIARPLMTSELSPETQNGIDESKAIAKEVADKIESVKRRLIALWSRALEAGYRHDTHDGPRRKADPIPQNDEHPPTVPTGGEATSQLEEIVKQAQENAVARENITLKKRTDYSISHILAAAHFARLSGQVEKAYDGKASDELFHEHRAYVTGCVVSSISFLEAKINELFADTVDNPNAVRQLDERARDLLSGMWKGEIVGRAGYPILEKFQLALALAGKDLFDRGKRPYQEVALLVRLRNALVHYVPEWVTYVSPETEALENQGIKESLSGKFELNPLRGPADPFFPDRCLAYGCAKWAVTSCIEFADEFFSRMGLPRPYDHIRPRLNTE